jgi:membrane-bound ClpP family serine protease
MVVMRPASPGAARADQAPEKKPHAQAEGKDPAKVTVGRTTKITLPITAETFNRTRLFARRALEQAQTAQQQLVLIFEFEVLPRQAQFGRGSEFGASYDLADFLSGSELNAARTVAYIPKSIQGHAVLAAMACGDIIMGPEAEIGPAGVDEPVITATMFSAYKEISNRRKTVPTEIALKMLDPSRRVLQVESEIGTEFVTPEGLKEVRRQRTVRSSQELSQPGRFTGAEGRSLRFVSYLASSRLEMARALDLPPEAVDDDPSQGDRWQAVRVTLRGPVRSNVVNQVQAMITEELRKNGVNFICLWIDSAGGSPIDSLHLASFLAELDRSKVRTVAYIPIQARSDAALIAMACDQVVMHPRAVLGGPGLFDFGPESIRQARETIQAELGPRKARSWSLLAAMVDPDLDVYAYRRNGVTEYFCEEELAEQRDPAGWKRGELVTAANKQPLQVFGDQAVQLRLANRVAADFMQFKQYYGLERDPALLEPGWADFLIEALGSSGVAALLLVIGFVAMYAELQAPGIGLGGFIAAVCFLLFFWSRFLGGTAGWLEVLMFLTGISCVVLEIFVLPGLGIFALGGGLLILASLILASQTFIIPHNVYQLAEMQHTLWMLMAAVAGVVVAAVVLRRWLPSAPIMNQILLEPPSRDEVQNLSQRESLGLRENLLGASGTTTTPLMPGGKARIGNQLLDVIADGEAIPRGTEVVVTEVHGSRISVRSRNG